MDISRNVAMTAMARSANWSAIRALNTQARPSLRAGCSKSLTTCRHITFTSAPQEAQEQDFNSTGNTPDARFSQPVVTREEDHLTLTFRRRVDHEGRPVDRLHPNAPDISKSAIRQRLRLFERDVLNSARTVPDLLLADPSANGMRLSSSDAGLILDEEPVSVAETPLPAFEEGVLVDFGDDRSFLLPGDLVEFRSSGNRVELAIFIRQLELQGQFYTMSGKWLHKQSRRARFFVPQFASPEEFEPLLAYLPDKDVPEAIQDQLQKFENSLPRKIGGPLVTKMREFQKAADNIYRENASALDDVYQTLARPLNTTSIGLPDAVRKLLPGIKSWERNVDGSREAWVKDNMAAVYAVYRALKDVNIGIKPIATGNFRSWGKYEIAARNIRDTVSVTMNIVRLWQKQDPFHRVDSTFGRFIKKAQSAIDRSRKNRAPTIFGQVGPAQQISGPFEKVHRNHFDAHDLIFIRFIQCWAGWKTFDNGSDVASTGSAILRAIGRYDNHILDQSSAWLLLQELGYITPWEIPTLYRLRLEGRDYQDSFIKGPDEAAAHGKTAASSAKAKYNAEVKEILDNGRDVVADLRHDWNDLTAFCIDDPSAHEIDDALSITRTEADDVYWVHVHVADPASIIDPQRSPSIRGKAQWLMANTYLPGLVITMLPDELVQKKLSLAPGRPTLTFSAKVNSQGEMLDHKITPGFINKVVYVSPATTAVVCGHSGESADKSILEVGNELGEGGSTSGSSRHMSSVDELKTSEKEDLQLLASLGAARRKHNLLRGGTNLTSLNMEIVVKHAPSLVEKKPTSIRDMKHFLVDPYIALVSKTPTTEGDISPLMVLAAEVAAQWCKDRNIPIIYRVSQKHPGKEDPSTFFKKNILPYYMRDEEAPLSLLREYLQSVGSVLPSTVPGPHVPLGVNGFSRCTSPLRRYSDMITHWQIEAALLQEAKTGKSLIGSTDTSYLPFAKEAVQLLIPQQDEANYSSRVNAQRGNKEWALQALLRAWKFGEGKTKLPNTFTFDIFRVNAAGVGGFLEELGLTAQLDLPKFLNGFEDITVGDRFEVELRSVNPYSGIIWVNALQKFGAEQTKKVGMAVKYL